MALLQIWRDGFLQIGGSVRGSCNYVFILVLGCDQIRVLGWDQIRVLGCDQIRILGWDQIRVFEGIIGCIRWR